MKYHEKLLHALVPNSYCEDQCIITREEIDDDNYYQNEIYNYKEFNFARYKEELIRNIKDMHNDVT